MAGCGPKGVDGGDGGDAAGGCGAFVECKEFGDAGVLGCGWVESDGLGECGDCVCGDGDEDVVFDGSGSEADEGGGSGEEGEVVEGLCE